MVRDELIKDVAGGPGPPVDYRQVLAAPRGRWVASVVEPLLLLEAPQNSPAGGAFLTSLVAGETGPHQIDWEWWPGSRCRRPAESVLLVDRDTPPVAEGPLVAEGPGPAPERTEFEVACHAVPWFWMTLLWNAKHAARHGGSLPMLGATTGALGDLARYLGHDPLSLPDQGPDPFRTLAALADRMDRLRSTGSVLFSAVPAQVGPQARRFIEFAASVAGGR